MLYYFKTTLNYKNTRLYYIYLILSQFTQILEI